MNNFILNAAVLVENLLSAEKLPWHLSEAYQVIPWIPQIQMLSFELVQKLIYTDENGIWIYSLKHAGKSSQ